QWRSSGFFAYNASNARAGENVSGRTDYAANCGDAANNEFDAGPGSLAAARTFNWGVTNKGYPAGSGVTLSGVCFLRSVIEIGDLTDGTSKTYFAGEKYLDATHYTTGNDPADNETWCTGYNNDNF